MNLLLNYVYLENANLNPGEVQNFMVSLGEDEVELQEGTLSLVHPESGEEVKIISSEISGSVMKFSAESPAFSDCMAEMNFLRRASRQCVKVVIYWKKMLHCLPVIVPQRLKSVFFSLPTPIIFHGHRRDRHDVCRMPLMVTQGHW